MFSLILPVNCTCKNGKKVLHISAAMELMYMSASRDITEVGKLDMITLIPEKK